MSRSAAHCRSADTLLAALLYLMNAYQRRPCRCLASCIAQHCEHLSAHPDAGHIVRQVVSSMAGQWQAIAWGSPTSQWQH